MRIGELSERSGTPVRTIRFYEEKGFLPAPIRTQSGYRDYDDDAVNRLRFVSAAQGAGLRLAEITSILAVRDAGDAPCEHTTSLLRAKRDEIDARLTELGHIRKEVDSLLDRSATLDPADCDPAGICQVIRR
ncbi:MAG: heavy metal-responsive transcriptional regulator [Acidimicrobiia bacterium]|nr:heavy metal-responsive transcriptional regulator [Acidimicrobiia bacterium]